MLTVVIEMPDGDEVTIEGANEEELSENIEKFITKEYPDPTE